MRRQAKKKHSVTSTKFQSTRKKQKKQRRHLPSRTSCKHHLFVLLSQFNSRVHSSASSFHTLFKACRRATLLLNKKKNHILCIFVNHIPTHIQTHTFTRRYCKIILFHINRRKNEEYRIIIIEVIVTLFHTRRHLLSSFTHWHVEYTHSK